MNLQARDGGVRNRENYSDIVYGWSLCSLQERSTKEGGGVSDYAKKAAEWGGGEKMYLADRIGSRHHICLETYWVNQDVIQHANYSELFHF